MHAHFYSLIYEHVKFLIYTMAVFFFVELLNITSLAGFSLHLLALLDWGVTVTLISQMPIVSVVVILFIQLAVVITFSCFYFIPLACSLYRYWIQQLFFCQSVYIFYQSKSLFLQSFFFFFFIAFMTESICLLIYTKREKYMTYLQCCFCLIFT